MIRIESFLFFLLILFLPTQLGLHFWPDFASVLGIRIDYLSPTIYLTDILVFLLLAIWFAKKIKEKLLKKSKTKNKSLKIQSEKKYFSLYIFIATILFLLFNILISGRILGGLYSSLKFLEMAFLAYYSAKFISEKNAFQKIIQLLSIAAIFQSILAIFQFLKHGSVGGLLYFLGERSFNSSTPGIANASLSGELVLRPYGTFPHPNVLGGYLLIVMILIIFPFQYGETLKMKTLKAAGLFLGTVALFLSMSRIVILLWAVILVYYLLAKTKDKLYAAMIIGAAIIVLLTPLGARFTDINIQDEAIVQRQELIGASLIMLKENPLFGVGLGNFLPTLGAMQKPLLVGTYLQPVHNIFFLIAAETGLIGLGLFVWFLVKTLKRLVLHKSTALLIAFSSILVLGLFDHYWLTLQQGQLLFAFIIGISWANNVKSKK